MDGTRDSPWKTRWSLRSSGFAPGNGGVPGTSPPTRPPWRDSSSFIFFLRHPWAVDIRAQGVIIIIQRFPIAAAMSFYKKYELQRLIADGEAKTFRAIENSTGRLVYLHLFNPSGQRLLAILKSKLGSVPGKPVAPLLEIGEFAGSTYAVTLPIEPFSGLREWVAFNLDTSAPKMGGTSPLLLPPSKATPVETTPVPPLVSETPAPPPPSPIPSPPPAAAPPGLLADQAGDFTRMFDSGPPEKQKPLPPAAPPPSPIPSPPPAVAPPGLLADQAGDFTRMFDSGPPEKQKPLRS